MKSIQIKKYGGSDVVEVNKTASVTKYIFRKNFS